LESRNDGNDRHVKGVFLNGSFRLRADLQISGYLSFNARVNRRLPAKLVDVLLNNQLGWCAKTLCCT
jgi:hypothetical protein